MPIGYSRPELQPETISLMYKDLFNKLTISNRYFFHIPRPKHRTTDQTLLYIMLHYVLFFHIHRFKDRTTDLIFLSIILHNVLFTEDTL